MTSAGALAALLALTGVTVAWLGPRSEHFLYTAVLVAGCVWFSVAIAFHRRTVPLHWIVWIPAACSAWAAMQVLCGWTVAPYQTWSAAAAWLAHTVMFLLAFTGFRDPEHRQRWMTAFVWFGGFYAALTLLGWFTGHGKVLWIFRIDDADAVAGTFANRNHYASLMALLLPFALTRSLVREKTAVPAVSAGLMFASVVVTASRAGMIILAVEATIIVAAALLNKQRSQALVLIASLSICTLTGGWAHLASRFAEHDPFSYRREMLTATAAMIDERPVTGFGLGSWSAVYPRFAVFDPPGVFMNHAHNDWAEWAADGGLPMVVLMAVLGTASAALARRRMWALGAPAVLVHALVDYPMHRAAVSLTLMVVAGMAAAAWHSAVDNGQRPTD